MVPELGKPAMYFDPCDFAGHGDDVEKESYTKRTALWGNFNAGLELARHDPIYHTMTSKITGRTYRGSWAWKQLGGKTARTKKLRGEKTLGFARAFANAQDNVK